MKLKVELMYWNGVLGDDDPGSPEPSYELIDADTNESLFCFRQSVSYEQVEAYIAARHPGCERWVPPPAPPNEAAGLARVLEMLESGIEFSRDSVRGMLIGQIYQSSYPDETVVRIRAALTRMNKP